MTKKLAGFTLIELILYIGIAAMVIVIVVGIGRNVILTNTDTQASREVYMSARLAESKLQEKIRAAEGVVIGSSIFGANPGKLVLDYAGSGTDVIFDTYGKIVDVGGLSVAIIKLRMKDGAADYVDLTNDKVSVSNFMLSDLTRASERENVGIELDLEKVNPGDSEELEASISLDTAISVRE